MMTPSLKTHLDEKWEDCWPVSTLRPLAILDLLSYIFFIKRLSDKELLNKKSPFNRGNSLNYTSDVGEFTWGKLRNMDAQRIHELFTGEYGLIDLMGQYGTTGGLYSDFFKIPPLLTPTPKLLFNVIQIINLIETSDKNDRAAIMEYLISKDDKTKPNGQVNLPENISWLLAAIGDPGLTDTILDPSVGNGNLLANSAKIMANKDNSLNPEFKVDIASEVLKGMDSELIQLRIAALNMFLHGIKNPQVQLLDLLPDKILGNAENATLVISNLFFTEVEMKLPPELNAGETGSSRKDSFCLNFILRNLKPGGRVVVVVPEFFLYSNDLTIRDIRREIVDANNLEGVISLPAKGNLLLSGAGILIFNKHESTTSENVWFFKMTMDKEQAGKNEANYSTRFKNDLYTLPEFDDVNKFLDQWKSRSIATTNDTNDCFYVTANDIRGNNYILNFGDYKILAKTREIHKKAENTIADKKNRIISGAEEHTDHTFDENFPFEEKRSGRKVLSVAIVLILLTTAATGFYFFNFKNAASSFANPDKIADSTLNGDRDTSSKQTRNETNITTISSSVKKAVKSSVENKNTPKGYTVIDKAYFYSEPDITKRKNLYLGQRKDYVLRPTEEENGFVYVVYVNRNGETTRGWINKKDLQPVQ
jgi:type I restriction enzyme M protein